MIFPKIKSFGSPDLDEYCLPPDPDCCQVFIEAEIGPQEDEGAEMFSFCVVTPQYLQKEGVTRWGKGLLVVNSFTWQEAENRLTKLLSHCPGQTWGEVARKLNLVLNWEFENYQAYKPPRI